jgi:hypothetical protein
MSICLASRFVFSISSIFNSWRVQVLRRRTTHHALFRYCKRPRCWSTVFLDRYPLLASACGNHDEQRLQVLVLLASYARGRCARLQRNFTEACECLAECAEAAEVTHGFPPSTSPVFSVQLTC